MGIQGVPMNRKEIIKAIKKAKGKLVHAAGYLGCDLSTLYIWRDKDKEIRELIEAEREKYIEGMLEMAEDSLAQKIKALDTASIIFTLKTQGKKRGWGQDEIKELTEAIQVIVRGARPQLAHDGKEMIVNARKEMEAQRVLGPVEFRGDPRSREEKEEILKNKARGGVPVTPGESIVVLERIEEKGNRSIDG